MHDKKEHSHWLLVQSKICPNGRWAGLIFASLCSVKNYELEKQLC